MNAIEVDKVSKKYYKYDSSEKNLRHLFKQRKVMENFEDGAFWALENVSFNIEVGTTVGLVGRNGSGKSTLLKIISRITNPTKGQLRIWGRVASLLEVGTGKKKSQIAKGSGEFGRWRDVSKGFGKKYSRPEEQC